MVALTERELEVARLIADGYTYDEIGEHLSMSPRTAKAYAERIKLKIGVNKKRQIGRVLKDLGLL